MTKRAMTGGTERFGREQTNDTINDIVQTINYFSIIKLLHHSFLNKYLVNVKHIRSFFNI